MSPQKPKRRIEAVTIGNVRVPIHRSSGGRWAVVWREYDGAPRQRRTFTTKPLAFEHAREVATAIANGQSDALALNGASRDEYRLACNKAAECDLPLHTLVTEAATARRILGPDTTLSEAATFYRRHHSTPANCPPTADLVTAILQHLRTHPAHRRSPAYLRALTGRLTAFASAFPSFPAATGPEVEQWITALTWRGQPIAPKTYNHYRAAVHLLWKWAVSRHTYPDPSPCAAIAVVHAPGKREVYTPAELRAALTYSSQHLPEFVPLIAIGAFAGLRPCEIQRIAWSAFHWKAAELRIEEEVAGKRGTPRNVPICPALAEWCAPCRASTGRIYDVTDDQFERATKRLATHLETDLPAFRWKPNAWRHSFGSYHVAQHQNLELTRLIMGTGQAMLRHHYNNPRYRADASAWWAIRPARKARNIISIATA